MRTFTEYLPEADDLIAKRLTGGPTTINIALKSICARFPQKKALIFKSKRLSYQELEESVESLAVILQRRFQIQKGDRIKNISILKKGDRAQAFDVDKYLALLECRISNTAARAKVAAQIAAQNRYALKIRKPFPISKAISIRHAYR